MKKQILLGLILISGFSLIGCSKEPTKEDLLIKWDETSSPFFDLLAENLANDQSDKEFSEKSKEVQTKIETEKKKIEKYSDDNEMVKDLVSLQESQILVLKAFDKQKRNEKTSPQEDEASYIVGKKTDAFSSKYNDGNHPESYVVLQRTFEKNNTKFDKENLENIEYIINVLNDSRDIQKQGKIHFDEKQGTFNIDYSHGEYFTVIKNAVKNLNDESSIELIEILAENMQSQYDIVSPSIDGDIKFIGINPLSSDYPLFVVDTNGISYPAKERFGN